MRLDLLRFSWLLMKNRGPRTTTLAPLYSVLLPARRRDPLSCRKTSQQTFPWRRRCLPTKEPCMFAARDPRPRGARQQHARQPAWRRGREDDTRLRLLHLHRSDLEDAKPSISWSFDLCLNSFRSFAKISTTPFTAFASPDQVLIFSRVSLVEREQRQPISPCVQLCIFEIINIK